MSESKINYVFELTDEQQELLIGILTRGNYRPRLVPYSIIAVEGNKFNCALYKKEKHGKRKLIVQGLGATEFVEFVLQPNGVVPLTDDNGEILEPGAYHGATAPLPHAGSDESGKGDYFGPLVVACCYVDDEIAEKFRNLKVEWFDTRDVKHVDTGGVRDCKLIANSTVLMRMGHMIKDILGPDRFNIVKIGPAAYNRLYAKIRNINKMLAWAHGTCIEGLLEQQQSCPRVIVDQFAPTETVIKRSMKERGKQVILEQRHKAESYAIGVAAASVLARDAFLRAICDMAVDVEPEGGPKYGVIPLGASDQRVSIVAERMVRKEGPMWLMNHCKAHFQTTDKVLQACNRTRMDLPIEGRVISAVRNGDYRNV